MMKRNFHTYNDEAIARALAESEGHIMVESVAPPPSAVANCPLRHGLERYQSSAAQRITCNGCKRRLREGESVWSCVQCNFDACEICYRQGSQAFASTTSSSSSVVRQVPPSASAASSSQFNNPFASTSQISSTHMCMIPCSVGGITVEMLVDTGAQTSVLSMPLVNTLGLANRLDRRTMGVAAGVGRARILGSIKNVVCVFGIGHVEFLMDFIVLEIQEPMVILGLDQLRKYKCLVDMEREKLVFGGAGGVEVEMLPAEQQHFDLRSLNGGCVLM